MKQNRARRFVPYTFLSRALRHKRFQRTSLMTCCCMPAERSGNLYSTRGYTNKIGLYWQASTEYRCREHFLMTGHKIQTVTKRRCENSYYRSTFLIAMSSYREVLGDKSTMYIRVTYYWGYLTVLWLLHLLCILYCNCFNLFCNVWVCVCVGFVMCGRYDNFVGVLIICVLVFALFCIVCTVFLYCFVCAYLFLFVLSVLV